MDNIFDLEEAAARETTAAPTYNNIAGLMPGYAWLEQLNPEQKQAVETTEGPVLVLSGAGTGKTKVLTTRLAYILATGKAQPWNCLVVTFTNRAAREMKERVQKMIGDVANSVWLGTFHSVCVKNSAQPRRTGRPPLQFHDSLRRRPEACHQTDFGSRRHRRQEIPATGRAG